ncbi:MAG: TetR/AcrR family transcriptional regulator [bacterium]|nr:TetR/AcrR family transcriptional regulator [bacterium]
MSRKSVQKERKLQIFEALNKCLLEKPFHETSTREIAKIAEVNHGMLYYFFKSKEDILLHFIDYTIEKYRASFTEWYSEKSADINSEKDIINAAFSFMINKITLNKELSKVFIEIWAIANYNENVREKVSLLYSEWETATSETLHKAGIEEENARILSTAIVSAFEGMALFSIILNKNDNDLTEVLKWYQNRVNNILDSRQPE